MVKLTAKIIPQENEKVIGWKGNVLEIGLKNVSKNGILEFFKENFLVQDKDILIDQVEGNLYEVSINTKYIEDIEVFLS